MQCDPTDRLLAEKSKYDTAIDLYNNHHLLQMEKIGDTCYGCAVCVCFSRHVIAETVNKANIDTDFSLLTRCFDKSYALYCRKVDEMLITPEEISRIHQIWAEEQADLVELLERKLEAGK